MRFIKGLVVLGAIIILIGFAWLMLKAESKRAAQDKTKPLETTIMVDGRVSSLVPLDGGVAILLDGEGQQTVMFMDTQGRVKSKVRLTLAK